MWNIISPLIKLFYNIILHKDEIMSKQIKAILGEDGIPEIQAVLLSSDPQTRADGTRRIIRVNIVDSETAQSTEEVDVYTIADAVYTNEKTGETILDYIDFRLKISNSTNCTHNITSFHSMP